jgi:hypothetical protein
VSELRDASLPVGSINEALLHLRRPFTAAAVKWKVQTVWKNGRGGIVVAYIDARLVVERLNRVVGGAWSATYDPAGTGLMWCHLAVHGVTRSDMGAGQGQGSMAAKANVSDALKRAGVHFGIGQSIYAMAQARLEASTSPSGNQLEAWEKTDRDGKKKWSANLTPGAELWLREKYDAWLAAKGEPLFGPVLDHGDEVGAQGADDEPATAAPEPEEQTGGEPVLRDERAAELLAQIETVYGEIRKMNAAAIPPAKYRADRDTASTSHEALEAHLAGLVGIRDEMKAARK